MQINRYPELDKVLSLILKALEEQKVLELSPDARKELIEKTIENIKDIVGEKISLDTLKENPALKLQLATALIATHKHGVGQDKFNFALLFNTVLRDKDNKLVLTPEKLDELNESKPDADTALLKTLPRPEPGKKSKKSDDDNVLAVVADDAGNVLDVLDGVGVSRKDLPKSIITVSELLSSGLFGGSVGQELQEELNKEVNYLSTPRLDIGHH